MKTLFQFVLAFVFSTVTFASTIRGSKNWIQRLQSVTDMSLDVVLNKLENYLT
jgi:iron complex outermembrane receptor protein